ncbi:MAG: hypothetical protein ACU85E_05440 [Gammaproteobacteria bacterium]
MNGIANFVMKGPFNALAVAGLLGVLSQFVMPLALLSNAIIALYVLSRRNTEWLVVTVGTMVLVVISSFFVEARPGIGFPLTLILLVPVVMCAKILEITESLSLSILLAVVCAIVLAVSIQLVSGDAVQWWSDWMKVAVTGVKNASYEGFVENQTLNLMNGLVAMMLVFAAVLTVFIGRWLQAMFYHPGGFSKEFTQIKFSFAVLVIMVVVLLVTAVINENLFKDFILIFTAPFFFQGLAVLHYTVNALGRGQSYLWPPYLLLLFFPQYVIVGMAGVGLVDVVLNFRNPAKKL